MDVIVWPVQIDWPADFDVWYALWRVSHPYRVGVAVRLICWFPSESDTVVVALFAGDKARIGDAFYNSVGGRADGLIDQWKREAMRGRS